MDTVRQPRLDVDDGETRPDGSGDWRSSVLVATLVVAWLTDIWLLRRHVDGAAMPLTTLIGWLSVAGLLRYVHRPVLSGGRRWMLGLYVLVVAAAAWCALLLAVIVPLRRFVTPGWAPVVVALVGAAWMVRRPPLRVFDVRLRRGAGRARGVRAAVDLTVAGGWTAADSSRWFNLSAHLHAVSDPARRTLQWPTVNDALDRAALPGDPAQLKMLSVAVSLAGGRAVVLRDDLRGLNYGQRRQVRRAVRRATRPD